MPSTTSSLAPTHYVSALADLPEPPLDAWILEAQEASLRSDLAAAAHRPVGASDLMLLRLMDPVGLAATAHRTGIAGAGIAGSGDGDSAGVDETSPDSTVVTINEALAGNGASREHAAGVQRVTKSSERRAAAGSAAPAVATRGVASRAAAQELLDGIVVAQRISDYANAVQQRLLAAFCTPGVAVPISDLLDLGGSTLAAALATAVDEVAATREPGTHDGAAAPRSGGSPSGARVGHGESSAGSADCERAVCERTACGHAACEAPTSTVNPSPGPDAPAAGRADDAIPPVRSLSTRAPDPLGTETNRLGTATSNRIDDIAISRDRAITSPTWARVLRETAMKAASAEVACALHLAPVTARLRCENATEFVDHLPATLRAQERGEIDPYRARMLLERLDVLPPHLRARVERRVLPHALNLTSAAFRRLIDREVIAADPDAARRREERAKARRDVFSSRADDGTGVFTALVSAADAELAYRMLDSVAESLASAELARDRTRAQLRADTFTDLFRTLADTGYVSITRAGIAHQPDRASGAAASTVQCADEGASGLGTVDCSQHRSASEPDCDSPTGDSDISGQIDHPSGRDHSPCGWHDADPHASGGALSADNENTGRDSTSPAPSTRSSGSSDVDPASDANAHPDADADADADAQVGRSDSDAHAPVTNSQATGSPASAFMGAALSYGPAGTAAAIRRPVALNVYLDVETLANLADRPGEIGGFGAVTAETARALAASADTIRAILVRPADGNRACGTILDAGRTVYRPPDKTADYVIARDRTCCFPGCRMPARRCDLDHRHPYDSDGETCPCNLDALCRTHHRLKTFTSWSAVRDPDNDRLVWTSPLGRTYRTEQPHLLLDGNQDGDAELRAPDTETNTESGRPDTAIAVAVADDDPPPF